MSMDLGVWSAQLPLLPEYLPEPEGWKEYDGRNFVFEGEGWLILVAEGESKIDQRVKARFPHAMHLTAVSLEPIGAPSDGYRMLEATVRHLSKACDGYWIDTAGNLFRHDEGMF